MSGDAEKTPQIVGQVQRGVLLVLAPTVTAARSLGFAAAASAIPGGIPPVFTAFLAHSFIVCFLTLSIASTYGFSAARGCFSKKFLMMAFAGLANAVANSAMFASFRFITVTDFTLVYQAGNIFLVPTSALLHGVGTTWKQKLAILLVVVLSAMYVIGPTWTISMHVGGFCVALISALSDCLADQLQEVVTRHVGTDGGEVVKAQLVVANALYRLPWLVVFVAIFDQSFFAEERPAWLGWRFVFGAVLPSSVRTMIFTYTISTIGALESRLARSMELALVYCAECFLLGSKEASLGTSLIVSALTAVVLVNGLTNSKPVSLSCGEVETNEIEFAQRD